TPLASEPRILQLIESPWMVTIRAWAFAIRVPSNITSAHEMSVRDRGVIVDHLTSCGIVVKHICCTLNAYMHYPDGSFSCTLVTTRSPVLEPSGQERVVRRIHRLSGIGGMLGDVDQFTIDQGLQRIH